MTNRRKTRKIKLGPVFVGGGAHVSIQSMTNTDTRDIVATISQIAELHKNGCEIIRLAVPDAAAVDALSEIVKKSPIPVIADIHFDYRLALGAINAGVHGVRINPGNIGDAEKVAKVAEAAGNAGIPIRVGANSGSLPSGSYEKFFRLSKSREDAMVDAIIESALAQCGMLEKYGFRNIKVSLKASDVTVTVACYRKFASLSNYPLHLGVTEAGTVKKGTIKSAIGIGSLLLDGIGDTLRVSLTAPPVEEVKTAIMILESVGLRNAMPEIVSCPTCGRTEADLINLAEKVEALVAELKTDGKKINLKKIAVMGCVVNGPGEAKDAELGVAGGKGKFVLFSHGIQLASFPENEIFQVLKDEILKHSS